MSAVTQKTTKRLTKFNKVWLKTYPWLQEASPAGSGLALCKLCNNITFSISHGGENDIKRHITTKSHKALSDAVGNNKSLDKFVIQKDTAQELAIIRAETTFTYHLVQHGQSYLSTDCVSGLFRGLFPDSEIAAKYSCKRTKSSKIVVNVLANAAKSLVIQDLKDDLPYSLSTDASNKGNIKTFPIVLRYFSKEHGICTKLLSFFSLTNEKSQTVGSALKHKLAESNVKIECASSYGADNANVNFGKKQSVFTELQKANQDILAAGCPCHIIHNAFKYGLRNLRFELDVIITKIYNEFSSSTSNLAELKTFFEFLDVDYAPFIKHGVTRWLTLVPAVDRLIQKFEPVKSYFLSKERVGDDDEPAKSKVLSKFFQDELALAYLGFVSNVGDIFQKAETLLQKDDAMIIKLHQIIEEVVESLKNRKEDKFYGSIARQELARCDNQRLRAKFEAEAEQFLETTSSYIVKNFKYKAEIKYFGILELLPNVKRTYDDFLKIADAFKIKVNEDSLYDNVGILNKYLMTNTKILEAKRLDLRWVEFFEENEKCHDLFKIVAFSLSIPHSNAMCERVFSLMAARWNKERNLLAMATVEAELMIKENFKMTCLKFNEYLKTPDGIKLLKAAKNSDKYN